MGLRYTPSRLLGAAAVIGSVTLISACGSASHKHTVSLARAADVSTGAAGYKMNMTIHEKVSGHTVALTANGSFTPKTHQGSMTMHMAIPGASGAQSLQLQLVMANDTIYVQLPPTLASKIPGHKPWVSINLSQLSKSMNLPGVGSMSNYSSTLSNPGQYLDFLRAAASGSVKNVGQQTIDGTQTTHYQADLEFSKLPDAVPASQRQAVQKLVATLQKRAHVSDMPINVWIDSSNLVRRIALTLNETAAGHTISTAITENFTSYGTQPAPTVPSPNQTTNLLSLMHGSQLKS